MRGRESARRKKEEGEEDASRKRKNEVRKGKKIEALTFLKAVWT